MAKSRKRLLIGMLLVALGFFLNSFGYLIDGSLWRHGFAAGLHNYATGSSAGIGGGFYNIASGYVAYIGGGDLNWNRIVPGTIRAVLRGHVQALAHEGVDPGVAPAEGAVGLGGIPGVADREHVPLEARGDVRVPRPARLLEGRPGVGGERLGPEVGVVARGVAVVRKEVEELRRAVAHDDLAGHADGRERLILEGARVDGPGAGGEVELHVDDRSR